MLFVSLDVNPQGFAFFGGDKSPSFGVGLFSYCFALGNHIECMSWIPLFLMLFLPKSLRPSYLWVHNQTIFNGLQSLHLVATKNIPVILISMLSLRISVVLAAS